MKKKFKTGEFAKLCGVCTKTLMRWDKAGYLPSHRLPSGRRYYTMDDYDKYFHHNK